MKYRLPARAPAPRDCGSGNPILTPIVRGTGRYDVRASAGHLRLPLTSTHPRKTAARAAGPGGRTLDPSRSGAPATHRLAPGARPRRPGSQGGFREVPGAATSAAGRTARSGNAEIAKSARRGRSTPASSGGKMPPTGEAVMTTDATSFVELLHSRNGLRRSRRHRGRGARRGDGDAIRALAAQRRRGARGALRPTPALDLRDAPRQARRDHSDLDELAAERPIDAELTDHTRFRPDLPRGATGKLQRIGLARRGLA